MSMQMRVDQAVRKAVHNDTAQNQDAHKEEYLRLSEAVGITVPVVVGACKEPSFDVGLRLEDGRGLDETMKQMSLPARVMDVTKGGF